MQFDFLSAALATFLRHSTPLTILRGHIAVFVAIFCSFQHILLNLKQLTNQVRTTRSPTSVGNLIIQAHDHSIREGKSSLPYVAEI